MMKSVNMKLAVVVLMCVAALIVLSINVSNDGFITNISDAEALNIINQLRFSNVYDTRLYSLSKRIINHIIDNGSIEETEEIIRLINFIKRDNNNILNSNRINNEQRQQLNKFNLYITLKRIELDTYLNKLNSTTTTQQPTITTQQQTLESTNTNKGLLIVNYVVLSFTIMVTLYMVLNNKLSLRFKVATIVLALFMCLGNIIYIVKNKVSNKMYVTMQALGIVSTLMLVGLTLYTYMK